MATDVVPPPTGARALLGSFVTSDVEREALRSYGLPLPIRVAGYVAACGSLVDILITALAGDPRRPALCLALGLVFLLSLHLSIRLHTTAGQRVRLPLVAAQIGSALLLQHLLSDDIGTTVLFYIVAAELQFVLPRRPALAGAFLLWPLAVVAEVTSAAGTTSWSPRDIMLLAVATLSGYVFVAVFTHSAVTAVVQRHRATALLEELNEAHARLQIYVDEVEELAVTRERNRLAREIHDTLGHYLAIINVQLETAQKVGARDPDKGQAAVATAKRLASECLTEVRRSVAALRPAALDAAALLGAVRRLADETRRATGLVVHVAADGEGALPPVVEVTVYRAIQEALTNVRKHAAAGAVWVELAWGADAFTACVRDDGRGAPPAGREQGLGGSGGFGLRGMRERVESLGGTLDIDTAPAAGFRVALCVPHAGAPGQAGEKVAV